MVRYDFPADTNRRGPELKISQDNYIETNIKPFDSEITYDMSAEINLEMAETIYDMRHEFKRQNKRLRKYYSSKEPKKYKTEKATHRHHFSKKRALA
jgi:hypothetical protein